MLAIRRALTDPCSQCYKRYPTVIPTRNNQLITFKTNQPDKLSRQHLLKCNFAKIISFIKKDSIHEMQKFGSDLNDPNVNAMHIM